MTFNITSSAFENNGEIPKKFSGEGEDLSTPLHWQNVLEGTKELVLICDDSDALATIPWVHWVIYKINPIINQLPEVLPNKLSFDRPIHAVQGKNSWNKTGYGGPMPPLGLGWCRYIFNLYAISEVVKLKSNNNSRCFARNGTTRGRGEHVKIRAEKIVKKPNRYSQDPGMEGMI
ncbi:MAG: YbhB/YbcL family Raf kinase inhibitor-like protein [Bdellovibrionota bacterium]